MTRVLLASADHYWPQLDGWQAATGADPMDLPLDRFLSLIYWFLIKDTDAAGIEKLDAKLWMPPPGVVAPQGPWTAESETAALGALQVQVTGSAAPKSPA